MGEHLFIVSRQQLDLYRYLSREFSSEVDVQVILDRRYGERRINGERRGQTEIGSQINSLGYAFVRLCNGAS